MRQKKGEDGIANIALRGIIESKTQDQIDKSIRCSIGLQLLVEPVILSVSGQTYEKCTIEEWLTVKTECPLTKIAFDRNRDKLIPNLTLQEWIEKNVPEKDMKEARENLKKTKKELAEVTWQWCNDLKRNTWIDYDSHTVKRLENAHKSGKQIVSVNASYFVDVKSKQQSDSESGRRNRPVRRIPGQLPSNVPYWFYKTDETKAVSRYPLEYYAPISPFDSQLLEIEFQKTENERNMVQIGPNSQFIADVTYMCQLGGSNLWKTRSLKRVE